MTTSHKQNRRVRFQDRSFATGRFVGVNGYRVNLAAFGRLVSGAGYMLRETPHFLLGLREGAPTLIIHRFAPEEIDRALGHYFIDELRPAGLVTNPEEFAHAFAAVIGSLFPSDPDRGWHLFSSNILQRYHRILDAESEPEADDPARPADVFVPLYRRVSSLIAGNSLLDAGCLSGYLPLLLAEKIPSLTRVVGVDISADPFTVSRAIAAERGLTNVQFAQADLLSPDLRSLGCFDTVTTLHVLEHFTAADMYRVLANLLSITSQRLLIAVPYETDEPEPIYGHQQLFTPEKLQAVGQWCLEQWPGNSMHYEECAGGLLYIDR
ncbi:MAG TPA: methyltransferase domain-containing protein [Ktedonobacteraceae bacterium]|nr:methyltransferase domain-containing protein [Ktedonobacteraceae bacterium]